MATSVGDNKKSCGRPATGIGKLIGVRLQPGTLAKVDRFAEEQGCTRPEAIRQLVEAGIKAIGE